MEILQVLDTALAFVMVMLILSILVMGLVQITQSMFAMRGRNLFTALTKTIHTLEEEIPEFSGGGGPRVNASKMLQGKLLGLDSRKTGRKLIRANQATTIENKDFLKFLPEAAATQVMNNPKFEDVCSNFVAQAQLGFRKQIRLFTFFWALVVAVFLQVSTPELLRNLSVNPELRKQVLQIGEEANFTKDTILKDLPTYEDISGQALKKLQANHPELTILEAVGGEGANRLALKMELRSILEDVEELADEEKEALVLEYDALLENLHKELIEGEIKNVQGTVRKLGRMNISFWKHGDEFYMEGPNDPLFKNWIGVFITALLLQLGAPFWFERLKELASLKDVLVGTSKKVGQGPSVSPLIFDMKLEYLTDFLEVISRGAKEKYSVVLAE